MASTRTRPLTFIVGTGLTGTALSRVLHQHPEVLSVNELLASLTPGALPSDSLDGDGFWKVLSQPQALADRMIRSGAASPEFLYPKKPGRHSAVEGIPGLSLMVLPALTDEPDRALDQLEPIVRSWPTQDTASHYQALFDALAAQYGGRVVVEHSGYSVGWIPRIREVFPEARLVHLTRNGLDCAQAMSRHPGYRMIYVLRQIVQRLGLQSIPEIRPEHIPTLPPDLVGLFADPFDPRLLMERVIPIEEFGAFWSDLMVQAVTYLEGMTPGRFLAMDYDALIDQPGQHLRQLCEFLDIDADPDWLDISAGEFQHDSAGSTTPLPHDEHERLRASCATGEQALANFDRRSGA